MESEGEGEREGILGRRNQGRARAQAWRCRSICHGLGSTSSLLLQLARGLKVGGDIQLKSLKWEGRGLGFSSCVTLGKAR